MRYPKHMTPERRAYLAVKHAQALADRSGWEVDVLKGEYYHPAYESLKAMLHHEWAAEDREERAALLRLEQERLHPREHIRQGGFDSIMRDIFMANQPTHYPEGPVGMDVIRCQPVVKVRVASSPVRLWVDVPTPQPAPEAPAPEGGWSKNALRKWRRYGKGPIARAIQQAVSDYHNSPS